MASRFSANRFSIRKFIIFGFLRPRWGVRGSLFAAFAVIAGMAIVIRRWRAWCSRNSASRWSI